MPDIARLVRSLGGMAQKRQLVAYGARDWYLTAAVRSGDVVRVRNGWYSTLAEDDPRLRAVRVGGRLTGISALVAEGAWVLGEHPLHVSLHQNAARLRSQWNRHKHLGARAGVGVRLHWDEWDVRERGSSTSVGLADALRAVICEESLETSVAVLDWALHTGAIDRIDFEALILSLPAEYRGIADWVDASCESLPESLSRTRLRLGGHHVVSQVRLGELQRIDLVVDNVAAIEVDGDEHHRARFEQDRRKDIDITIAKFHALRPSARTVFSDWERFALAVEIAIDARRPVSGNSGHLRQRVLSGRGMAAWRGGRRRRSPEFSDGRGASGNSRRPGAG